MSEFTPVAPTYVVSSHRKKPVIQYKNKRWEGTLLEFCWKSKDPKHASTIFYQCIACKGLANLARNSGDKCGVAHLKMVLKKRYGYETRTAIRESRKRPRMAYDESIANVSKRFKDEFGDGVVNEIKTALSSGFGYNSHSRSLTRNRSHFVIKDNTLEDIHSSLKITKDDEKFLQTYDLTDGRQLLVFYADSDLETLLNAEYILGDGNHKYNPPEFHNPGEMYTLHVVVKGECHPFLFALTKKLDREAYCKILDALRQGMLRRFGHLGNLTQCTWLFDYEPAVMGACQDVFNPTRIQGCSFHFSKALNAKRDEIGLKEACQERDENGNLTHQANSLKKWFRRVRHLCFLPEHLRIPFARDFFARRPVYPNALINAQLRLFSEYFNSYWLTVATIRDVWGQFNNFGPRTTNYVEGWHNGLHSRLNGRHPSLAELIGLFQISQHSSKFRIQALKNDPLTMPLPQKPAVIRRNVLVQDEMRSFEQYFTCAPVTLYQDILNYVDRIIDVGVLSQQL